MRDWVIALIVLLILVIVVDGIRRWRKTRRENIQLSRNAKRADQELGEKAVLPSEFPSGGARVVKQRAPEDVVNVNSSLRESFESRRLTAGSRNRIPQQVALKLDEALPESVKAAASAASNTSMQVEPTIQADMPLEELEHIDEQDRSSAKGGKSPQQAEEVQTSFWGQEPQETMPEQRSQTAYEYAEELDDDVAVATEYPPGSGPDEVLPEFDTEPEQPQFESPVSETAFDDEVRAAQDSAASAVQQQKQQPEPEEAKPEEEFIEPEEVLIINVTARRGETFYGPDLLQALMELDMKFGEMDIFHRHVNDDGSGPVLFSLANMVMPGTFNLAAMQSFSTPGISMFLSLPLPRSLEQEFESISLDAYNILAYTAQGLARALDGQLKDENRSVMTLQTIEHGRQRVIEYQRKRRLAQR